MIECKDQNGCIRNVRFLWHNDELAMRACFSVIEIMWVARVQGRWDGVGSWPKSLYSHYVRNHDELRGICEYSIPQNQCKDSLYMP